MAAGLLGACASGDEAGFRRIHIGQSGADAIAQMGAPPRSVTKVQLPLGIRAERLEWRPTLGSAFGPTYTVDVAFGYVIAKAVQR